MAPLSQDEASPDASNAVKPTQQQQKQRLSYSTDEMVSEATKHVAFLQALHAKSMTHHSTHQQQQQQRHSLDRYLNYWLPLVDQNSRIHNAIHSIAMIPPADIAWLWHCHRLAPARYERHVTRRFGRLVEPTLHEAFAVQFCLDECVLPASGAEDALATQRLWEATYPNQSFFLAEQHDEELNNSNHNPTTANPSFVDLDFFLKHEFELLESTERQATFLWQVSGPRFSDPTFLQEGVDNYVCFLQLFAKLQKHNSTTQMPSLIPTYQIDLMWHTHMLKSIQAYNKDCIALTGQRFHHDDSLNDRTEGGRLDVSFQQTTALWKQTYSRDYIVPGGMYRGEPPADYYSSMDPSKTSFSCAHDNDDDSHNHAPEHVARRLLLAGSFSAGKTVEGNTDAPPRFWLEAGADVLYEGQPTFIKANAKGKTPGDNTNPKKESYVFGLPKRTSAGQLGAGYYHMYTRDGWGLLVIRLQKRAMKLRSDYENFLCGQCACSPSGLSAHQLQVYENKEKEFKQVQDLYYFAKAQLETEGPGAAMTQSLIDKYRYASTTSCILGCVYSCH